MLKSPFLFAISVLISLVHWTGIAQAQELEFGLSFELPPQKPHTAVVEPQTPATINDTIENAEPTTPVRVEVATLPTLEKIAAELPPVESDSVDRPSSVGSDSVGTQLETTGTEISGTEMSGTETTGTETIGLSFAKDTLSVETLTGATDIQSETEAGSTTGLLFDETTDLISSSISEYDVTTAVEDWGETLGLDDWIFEDGTQSLVARTVGSAEGTRQLDGRHTAAYYGHVDPGNGAWNLGTFSYQHEATSPEEADERQLRRLKRQGIELENQARKHGFTLSLTEKLNGLDLANQAPLAALDRGGYIDRLAQAKRLQMDAQEAILWARTHSYIDPDTRQWNAPGLGNNIHSISRDQDRRMVAISDTLKAYSPTGIDSTSLASVSGVSLQSHGLDSPANRLAALGSPEVAQHVLSEMEVSFGLPPFETSSVEASSVEASSALVATVEQPLGETAETDSEAATKKVDVDTSIGVDLLPTGPLAEITTAQSFAGREEEISAEEATETAQSDSVRLSETNKPEAPEAEITSTILTTPVEENLDSKTEAGPTETEATEIEATSKLQALLSGIPNRDEPDTAKSGTDSVSASASEAEVTETEVTETKVTETKEKEAEEKEAEEKEAEEKEAEEKEAEIPEDADRASLWHTEDKIVQTK